MTLFGDSRSFAYKIIKKSMSKKYAWHPPSRPSPPEPSLAGKIVMMSPVAKCLENALSELLAADTVTNTSCSSAADRSNHLQKVSKRKDSGRRESFGRSPARKRTRATSSIAIEDQGESASVDHASRKSSQDVTEILEPTSNNMFRLDDSMSKSILQSYINAVSVSTYDREGSKNDDPILESPSFQTGASTDSRTFQRLASGEPKCVGETLCRQAPAAMLEGEIDHFNRIGGQWRLVVKNAVIQQRSTKEIENGMTGRSRRKRTVLAWSDTESTTGGFDGREESDCVHHLKGEIQILAYDDKHQ